MCNGRKLQHKCNLSAITRKTNVDRIEKQIVNVHIISIFTVDTVGTSECDYRREIESERWFDEVFEVIIFGQCN